MKRETGYYWVKSIITWEIGFYSSEKQLWELIGRHHNRFHPDSTFTEINETQIKNPDEK